MWKSQALENFFEQRHRQWEKRVRNLLHSLGRDRGPHSSGTGAKETGRPPSHGVSPEKAQPKNRQS